MRILFGRSFKRYKARTTAYRFRRSTATKFTDVNTVTVSNKTTVKTISKLYGGKRYYVRCRTYKKACNKNFFSSRSGAKAANAKK